MIEREGLQVHRPARESVSLSKTGCAQRSPWVPGQPNIPITLRATGLELCSRQGLGNHMYFVTHFNGLNNDL